MAIEGTEPGALPVQSQGDELAHACARSLPFPPLQTAQLAPHPLVEVFKYVSRFRDAEVAGRDVPRRFQLEVLAPIIRRWILRGIVTALVVPWVLILPLNLFNPPTTAVMLRRSAQRWSAGQEPAYPRRVVIMRAEMSPYLRRAVVAAEDDRGHDGTRPGPLRAASFRT